MNDHVLRMGRQLGKPWLTFLSLYAEGVKHSPDDVRGFGPRLTRTNRHVGRVRIRLAAVLAAHGYTVAPEDLHPQLGAWRTDVRLDVCRWEATVTDAAGVTWMVQCWDTMSACVRYGVTTAPDRRSSGYLNVSANRPGPPPTGGAPSSPAPAAAKGRGIRREPTGDQNR